MRFKDLKYLIVGSGFFGSVIAERLASQLDQRVVVVEARDHIGGNCYSYREPSSNIEVHAYGTHIFHTNNEKVWKYITQFTEFTPYQHKVLTEYRGQVYPMPISLATINSFYKTNLKPGDVAEFIAKESKGFSGNPSNLEEKAVSLIGRPLYEAFIRGYTTKQWERDPKELPADIITRLPVRKNYNTNYFNDPHQGLPKDGYGELFKRLLNHPNIEVLLNTDYSSVAAEVPENCTIVYTGPIDRFFGYRLGRLDWRSLRFEKEVLDQEDFQGTSVMNYADLDVPYTRIHEFKHLHPERETEFNSKKTVIYREYPKTLSGENEDCYYPVNTPRNEELFRKYVTEAKKLKNVIFGGRLGSYKYWDMDKAIENALVTFESLKAQSSRQ
jgi:UDP-galactopyranose mutase